MSNSEKVLVWYRSVPPPREVEFSRSSQFRASLGESIHLLQKEVKAVGGSEVTIGLHVAKSRVNRGRLLRGPAPAYPGVIVTADSARGPLTFRTARYERWKDNVRAAALSMQALRSIDRYGVSSEGEQYRGFAALLPAPGESLALQAAAQTLYLAADLLEVTPETFKEVYRKAVKRSHPDTGGSKEQFAEVQNAAKALQIIWGIEDDGT